MQKVIRQTGLQGPWLAFYGQTDTRDGLSITAVPFREPSKLKNNKRLFFASIPTWRRLQPDTSVCKQIKRARGPLSQTVVHALCL
jgi:hypothetical protein